MSKLRLRTRLTLALLYLGLAVSGPARGDDLGIAEARLWPFASPMPAFPIRVARNSRHLEDANGKPFLLQADVAGNILVQLRREDALLYLDDRRKRGFNTIVAGLIEKRFASHPPANVYGARPFARGHDFTAPQDDYFVHVEWFLEQAAQRGFLVAMTPAWLGFNAGPEGWYAEMTAAGREKLRDYGRYLGRRFGRFENVLWIHGGDYNPPDKDLVRAVAEGIREFDHHSLNTVHCAPGYSGRDIWKGEPWLQLDTVYTYGPVYPPIVDRLRDSEALPFLLMESAFENEHGIDERGLRKQAYQALLTGAAGHVFGNNPIWHFDGPGIYHTDLRWKDALASRGAQSMTHLRNLFSVIEWPVLVPDLDGRFLAMGHGEDPERAVAAFASNGSFAVVYLPEARPLTLHLARLAGHNFRMRWYDPSDGTFQTADAPQKLHETVVTLNPPSANRAGYGDWLLLVETEP